MQHPKVQKSKPNRKLFLITGVPGMGKTEIGNYLAVRHGFIHLDIEDVRHWSPSLHRLTAPLMSGDIGAFVAAVREMDRDTVITWGFMPEVHAHVVRNLQSLGCKFIWFGGNDDAARTAFIKRGTVPVHFLDIQMKRIASMNLRDFEPVTIINTFDAQGHFLEREIIAQQLFLI